MITLISMNIFSLSRVSQPIIPINKRNAKPPAGFCDFKGTPVCNGGHEMSYWDHYKGVNKFRCPYVCIGLIVFM